jgi:hypothetical protein
MYLYEELVLLAINPESNRFELSPSVRIFRGCIAGAILRDLELLNRIQISRKAVFLLNALPTGDKILDLALDYITHPKNKKGLRSVLYWIARSIPEIEVYVAQNLKNSGLIRWNRDHRKFVQLIDMTAWDLLHQKIFQRLIQKIPADQHDLALFGVARWCGVLRHHVLPYELRNARKYLDVIIHGDEIAQLIERIIQEEAAAATAAAA